MTSEALARRTMQVLIDDAKAMGCTCTPEILIAFHPDGSICVADVWHDHDCPIPEGDFDAPVVHDPTLN